MLFEVIMKSISYNCRQAFIALFTLGFRIMIGNRIIFDVIAEILIEIVFFFLFLFGLLLFFLCRSIRSRLIGIMLFQGRVTLQFFLDPLLEADTGDLQQFHELNLLGGKLLKKLL